MLMMLAFLVDQKFTNCKNTPSPFMGEGWGEGAPSPLSPPTRGGEMSIFLDVQLSVCKFLIPGALHHIMVRGINKTDM